jgi:DNA adenine methylase
MEIEPLRPFFGRMGGKSKIANNLISHFPDPNSYTTYVEPFIGAGNIFLRKPYKSKIEVINDLDDMVYSIFQGVKQEGQVIEKLKPISYLSKEQFYKLRENASNWIDYLFLIKTSFFAQGKSYDYPKEKNKLILVNTDFDKLKNRLKDVKITHLDFQTLIKKYNKPTTFFYLDPPYEDSKDYSNSVNPEDVYNAVKTIKGKFMLSYNDSPLIRKLFKEYNIHTIETIYEQTTLSKKRVINEVYITNY